MLILNTRVKYNSSDFIFTVGIDNDPCNDMDTNEKEPDGVLCRTHNDCQIFNQFCCQLNSKKICMKPPNKLSPATHQRKLILNVLKNKFFFLNESFISTLGNFQ